MLRFRILIKLSTGSCIKIIGKLFFIACLREKLSLIFKEFNIFERAEAKFKINNMIHLVLFTNLITQKEIEIEI